MELPLGRVLVLCLRPALQRAGLGDEDDGGGAAALRLGKDRGGADVDAANQRNVDALRQRSRSVREDDLAFHVDARKRIDVLAWNRPAVADVHDRQFSSHRSGERAHDEVVAETKALTVNLDRRGRRVDLRFAHRVVLQEGAIVPRRLETRLLHPSDDEPRRLIEAGRRRVAALQGIGRKVVEIAGKALGGNALGRLAGGFREAGGLRLQQDATEQQENGQTLAS